MKMKKPHQLLATDCIDGLFRYERTHPIAVAILAWLIESINRDYPEALHGTELGIVNGRFVGNGYPAMGIHYEDMNNPRDIGPLIEATVEKLVRERPISDLIEFLARSNTDWTEAARSIVES